MIIDRVARLGSALLLGALACGGAFAQAPAVTAIPAPGQMGYINGGVGEEQADLMRDMSAQFPVRFTFSRHNGTHNTDEFLADVRVRVVDSAGQTVLDLAQQGPIFLLRVPEGSYSVEAEHNGEVKSRRFQVLSGRHQEIAFSWAG
jgi:hypothetical protein